MAESKHSDRRRDFVQLHDSSDDGHGHWLTIHSGLEQFGWKRDQQRGHVDGQYRAASTTDVLTCHDDIARTGRVSLYIV